MRKQLSVAALLVAIPVAGCGGDGDGIYVSDEAVNTPARDAPPASGIAEAPGADGLLRPRRRPEPERRARRHRRDKRAGGRAKPRQQVAGTERQSANENASAPLGSLGEPEPVDAEGREPVPSPPLTAAQRDELESVRTTLHELFERLNARDSSLCTGLFTQRHVEEATGLRGPAAVARCRQDVAGSKAAFSLNKISGVRIEGDLALIRFASSIGDYARWQIFRAQRHAGGWRFDGDGAGDV